MGNRNILLNFFLLLRAHHWIKNVLVLFPLFFSGKLFIWKTFESGVYAFLIFSLLTSSIYLFNDIQDIENDRRHPEKRKRPLPAGIFKVSTAWMLFFSLTVISLGMDLLLSEDRISILILLFYWGSNIAYSKVLKKIPVIDFSILAAGFVLRVLYGGAMCNIRISHWLFLCVMAAALFMGIGKRRNELRSAERQNVTRDVLKHYTNDFLDKNMYLSAALAIVFYALWSVSPDLADSRMVFTVPLILLLFFRYSFLVESEKSSGDPVNTFLGDKVLCILSLVFASALFWLFYSGKISG